MKKTKFHMPAVPLSTIAKYFALLGAMLLMNCALPYREPLSFPLFYAALCCGFDPILLSAEYLLASVVSLNGFATLSALAQAALLLFVFALYRRTHATMRLERLFYIAAAQIPFIFLFPLGGYAVFPFSPLLQKVVIAFFIFILAAFSEGALYSLLHRAFRCRLTAGQLAEILLLSVVLGLGICSALTETAFLCIALSTALISAILLKNASAVPFSAALSIPLCLLHASILPLALFTVFSCAVLLFTSYGKLSAALGFALSFLAACFLSGLFYEKTSSIVLGLLPGGVAVVLALSLPNAFYKRMKRTLLFYRESALPRIAVNRNRRAIGERLYEVSSLFRDIESAFQEEEREDNSCALIVERLRNTLCNGCPNYRKCEDSNVYLGMEKLVTVGYAKGQVSLIDLPADISSVCANTAGLLFATNKLLAAYRVTAREIANAREGRKLLAEQAHGVSQILKDIALEQSEEYSFSECESALSAALAAAGILSSEIFVYGDGNALTVSMTLAPNVNGKQLCAVAGKALDVPLALAETIPLASNKTCYILKRKPEFDAAFGVASHSKSGESFCGDAYSILKIDERRFLVALSDGMGSGENAREISDKTLSLLESFYKAKMPSETVLSTVNRLIAYSPEETFACLDLAAVDLDTGDADVVKIGSPVGFILSREELRVLEGESLPMGMLDAVHPSTLRAHMDENDFMLFMSDGVTSAFGSSADLYSYLSNLHPINPQSLAEEVLGNALERYQGRAEDDMTVVAVKLMKSA